MNIDDIEELKHITYFEEDCTRTCLFSTAILHPIMKHYYPTAIRYDATDSNYMLYDYSQISLNLLKKEYLEQYDVLHVYNSHYSPNAIPRIKLSDVSLQQAQHIIDNNILLFNRVNEKLIQDKLLMQIEES